MTAFEESILKKMEESMRCPVCSLADGEEFNMLSHLRYDVSHDPQVREAVAREGGFCEFHFRQFRKIANARTNALLVEAVIALLKESSFRENYEKHTGLCLQHLSAVESLMADDPLETWLNDACRTQMQREIPSLEQMATKSYYDTSRLARGSVSRTVEMKE